MGMDKSNDDDVQIVFFTVECSFKFKICSKAYAVSTNVGL